MIDQPAAAWAHLPLSRLKRDTAHPVGQEGGRSVLRARAHCSASLFVARLAAPMPAPAMLRGAWKTEALVPGADNRDSKRDEAPLRLLAALGGECKTPPDEARRRMTRADRLTGRSPPFATLRCIWGGAVAAGSIAPSVHAGPVKMLAVASGADGPGRWHTVKRDLAADDRRASGAGPGPLLGVAVLTDTDNNDTQSVGLYADIRLDGAGN
jgi:hypothetical protein